MQIPAGGSTNWNVPLNYNFNGLDQLLGGQIAIPALNISGNLVVGGSITAGSYLASGGAGLATATPASRYSPVYFSASPTGTALSGVNPFTGLAKFSASAPPSAAALSDINALMSSATGCTDPTKAYSPAAGQCITSGDGGGGGGAGCTGPIGLSPAIDGSTTVFTLASPPMFLVLDLNGLTLTPGSGNDYTLSGSTVTMSSAPQVGDRFFAYSCAAGTGGSGDVATGPVNAVPYYTTNPTGTTVGPAAVTIDSNDSTHASLVIPKNFTVQNTSASPPTVAARNPDGAGNFPYQIASLYTKFENGNTGYSDFMLGHRTDLHTFSFGRFSLDDVSSGNPPDVKGVLVPNTQMLFWNAWNHGAVQAGGAQGGKQVCDGNGDCVRDAWYNQCRGSNEGFDEGCEPFRSFTYFWMNSPLGPIQTNIGADSMGRAQFRIQILPGYLTDSFGNGNMIINTTTKALSPPGNVTGSGTCPGDVRFYCLTVDSAAATFLNANLTNAGQGFHMTTVTSGADNQKYNGSCPATVVATTWGNRTIDGAAVAIDPYLPTDTLNMTGSLTTNQCVVVGSTAGMGSAGSSIVAHFWGSHDNWESTTMTVIDGTHIKGPLNFQHDAGELITWGAGTDYAISTPAQGYPAHTFDNAANIQYGQTYLYYPIMTWDSANSRLWIFTNSAANGNHSELKLEMFPSMTPDNPITSLTLTITGGVLTAITASPMPNSYTFSSDNITGLRTMTYPPTITWGSGCTTNPTVVFTKFGAYGYQPVITAGGSGCPPGLTATVNTTFPNPFIIAPGTRITSIQDPANGGDWRQGFLRLQALSNTTDWQIGDYILQPIYWQQYSAQNEMVHYSPLVRHSNRTGPQQTLGYAWVQNGPADGPMWWKYETNQTPLTYYWGRPANNYMPSSDPTQSLDAMGTPPIWRGVGGQHAGIHDIQLPPSGDPFGSEGDGYILHVGCVTQGQDGNQPIRSAPCQRAGAAGHMQAFDIFRVDSPFTARNWFRWSDQTNTFDFSTGAIRMQAAGGAMVAACRADGVNCPVPTPTYTIDWTSQPSLWTLNDAYYIGDTGVVQHWCGAGCDMGNQKKVPFACKAKEIRATAQLGEGGTPTTSTNTLQVNIHDWTTNADLYTQNFPVAWNTANQVVLDNTNPAFTVAAGDLLTARIYPPAWGETTHTQYVVSVHIFCSYN
jgi:hypothetical protein